jgi:hypothetical protein
MPRGTPRDILRYLSSGALPPEPEERTMQTLPRDVHKGMRVFDRTNMEIGKVEDFRFSENEDQPDVEPADLDAADRQHDRSLLENIADVFAPDELPEVLRERLLREGYIRLDAKGLFAADRYILPEQIASANGDSLRLAVTRDELMKRH